jgi:molybdopterin converting factor subunit 1
MPDTSVTILYFAWLRERIGTASEELTLPPQVETVANLVDFLAARGGGYATAFANRRAVRCAINQEFAPTAASVHPGDEVAFFPPVTGG